MSAHRALIDIPMPRAIAALPRDHRGYPVPYTVVQDPPQLAVIDPNRRYTCAMKKLCGVCGRKLGNKKWFVGAKNSARYRLFTFPAVHEECARYAIRVCPYIVTPNMKYSKAPLGDGQTIDPHIDQSRPECWYLLRTNGYKHVVRDGHPYVMANPWDYMEGWRHGEPYEGPTTLEVLTAEGYL